MNDGVSSIASPRARTLQSIQACRAAAALLVLLFHATLISKAYLSYDLFAGLFMFGNAGVDFFFVLSGFIIFWAHRDDIGRPKRVMPYLRKRFVRIYPVYWIIALALLPVYFGAPESAHDVVVLAKSLLLLPLSANPLVGVAWSLTHEVFFYTMFALAIYLPWRYTRPFLIGWLVVTLLCYCATLLTAGSFHLPAHTALILSPYNLEFAMGCVAGHIVGRSRIAADWNTALVGAALFLAFGVGESLMHREIGKIYSVLAFGPSSMLIVLGAVAWEQRRALAISSGVLLLGDASYSIYLTHYALLDISVKQLLAWQIPAMIGPALSAAVIIGFSVGIGILFYAFVERPLLASLRRPLLAT